MTYSSTISPTPSDPNLILFDPITNSFTIEGTALATAGLYTVTIEAISLH